MKKRWSSWKNGLVSILVVLSLFSLLYPYTTNAHFVSKVSVNAGLELELGNIQLEVPKNEQELNEQEVLYDEIITNKGSLDGKLGYKIEVKRQGSKASLENNEIKKLFHNDSFLFSLTPYDTNKAMNNYIDLDHINDGEYHFIENGTNDFILNSGDKAKIKLLFETLVTVPLEVRVSLLLVQTNVEKPVKTMFYDTGSFEKSREKDYWPYEWAFKDEKIQYTFNQDYVIDYVKNDDGNHPIARRNLTHLYIEFSDENINLDNVKPNDAELLVNAKKYPEENGIRYEIDSSKIVNWNEGIKLQVAPYQAEDFIVIHLNQQHFMREIFLSTGSEKETEPICLQSGEKKGVLFYYSSDGNLTPVDDQPNMTKVEVDYMPTSILDLLESLLNIIPGINRLIQSLLGSSFTHELIEEKNANVIEISYARAPLEALLNLPLVGSLLKGISGETANAILEVTLVNENEEDVTITRKIEGTKTGETSLVSSNLVIEETKKDFIENHLEEDANEIEDKPENIEKAPANSASMEEEKVKEKEPEESESSDEETLSQNEVNPEVDTEIETEEEEREEDSVKTEDTNEEVLSKKHQMDALHFSIVSELGNQTIGLPEYLWEWIERDQQEENRDFSEFVKTSTQNDSKMSAETEEMNDEDQKILIELDLSQTIEEDILAPTLEWLSKETGHQAEVDQTVSENNFVLILTQEK